MPKKKRKAPKKAVVFDVPAEVKGAGQSGWVYRSSRRTEPAGGAPPRRTRQAREPAPAAPRRPAAAHRSLLDALLMPFALPVCLMLSLLPATAPKQPSK